MWCIEKIICIFNNISSGKSFLWEIENDQKRNAIFESFVIFGSFDCDRTQTYFLLGVAIIKGGKAVVK